MAIEFIKQKKKQNILIVIFVVLILLTFIIFWRGYFGTKKIPPSTPAVPAEFIHQKMTINFDVLKNPILEAFQVMKEILPLKEDEMGRENPFLP